jgi:SAM-dependent methyltransferase
MDRPVAADIRIARVDGEDYHRTSRRVWEAMAPGWEHWRAQLAEALSPVREWLIREVGPKPPETVLELGAGTGETGFQAAALVGDGRLISTDFSPEMLEVARRRGTELGLGNVEYRVIDAERIELESGSVDGVLCQSAYMLVGDPAVALAETRRVLSFGFRDVDDYEQWVIDVAGPFAMVVRGLPEEEREVLRARLKHAFGPYAAHGGYELPGVALCAIAS